jgi:hypothetical protein
MWLSISADKRLCAEVIAWKSPVEVHLLHRHDLRHAAPGRAALHPEIGPERGLADAHHRLLADPAQPVAKPDRRRRLALACGRRVDRRHQHEPPVAPPRETRDELGPDLRLVVAIGQKRLGRNPELRPDFLDGPLLGGARNLDIALHGVQVPDPPASRTAGILIAPPARRWRTVCDPCRTVCAPFRRARGV